jgi:hypothetical protein
VVLLVIPKVAYSLRLSTHVTLGLFPTQVHSSCQIVSHVRFFTLSEQYVG